MSETVEEVEEDDALLRRVPDQPEKQWTKLPDGTVRPSGASMKPHSDDGLLSCDLRRLLDDPTTPTSVLEDGSDAGLVEFEALVPRSLGLEVTHSPRPENPAHVDISGFSGLSKAAAKRLQSDLAKAIGGMRWLKLPASASDGASAR